MQPPENGLLNSLLQRSSVAGPALSFIEACTQVLSDNQMPFFPAFTDHGMGHIEAVLAAAEKLVPQSVWEEGLVSPDDAAVLTASVYLHDLGLHIRESGFLDLVANNSRFKPLPWFNQDQIGRHADQPWRSIWLAFRREARSFSQSELDRILGPDHGDPPQIVLGDFNADPTAWTLNDRLIVGEFLRRHHARLAHEIAIYGFPGIPATDFPLLQQSAPSVAEAIGAVARSHNENLRVAAEYLESRAKGDLRPGGLVQLYLMGLLRIADFFQIESDRATPLLQHLREPQSPTSIAEWEKHQAVVAVSWDHRDPFAVSVQASDSHTLRTHLQLASLLRALQSELDLTSAVLGETFGATTLAALQLSRRRVRTNLDEPELKARLPFVPQPSFLRSAEDLFRLMVGDLYGNEPAIAGRELLQNAVDAVRERRRWEKSHGAIIETGGFRQMSSDILIEIQELDDEMGLLRVADRGVGMTPRTVVESFLTAGATFSPSPGDDDQDDSHVEHMKVGRFGIGVFAAFLLGSQIEVTTRYLDQERGITFVARLDDELVQLDWNNEAPLGTEISVPYRVEDIPVDRYGGSDDIQTRNLGLLARIAGYFALSDPSVEFLIRGRDGATQRLLRDRAIPSLGRRLPDHWRKVDAPSFDAVLWSIPARHLWLNRTSTWGGLDTKVAHNGFLIKKPQARFEDDPYEWSDLNADELVQTPSIAVFDTRERLKIALNRYELASTGVPFEDELLESIGLDLVAHALACGEQRYPLDRAWGLKPVVSRSTWLPLVPQLVDQYVDRDLCVLVIGEPEDSKIASKFLAGRLSTAGWRDLPFRAAVSPHEAYVDELDVEWMESDVSLLRSHAEKEVRFSIERGSDRLRRFPHAGVISAYGAPPTTLFEDPDDREVEVKNSLLLKLAEELAQLERQEYFALVALRPYDHSWPWHREEKIALAWEDILGGMLARSPKQRKMSRATVVSSRRDIGVLANKWERFDRATKMTEQREREQSRSRGLPF
jgi:molecular chaperone HtpG